LYSYYFLTQSPREKFSNFAGHSIGNIIGAFVASRFAVTWGANFVRWVMIVIIAVTVLHLFDIVDFKALFL